MKFTIELSPAEVAALRRYIAETSGTDKPSKADIANECKGLLFGVMRTGALGDFIQEEEGKL